MKAVEKLPTEVTLAAIKQDKLLADMVLGKELAPVGAAGDGGGMGACLQAGAG